MVRTLVVTIFIAIAAFATTKIDAQKIDDKSFNEKFVAYWQAYSAKDFKKMYSMESPYFKYLYDIEGYKAYVAMLYTPDVVKVLEVKSDDKIHIAKLSIDVEGKQTSYLSDRWIDVDGEFYHHSRVYLIYTE